MMYNGMRTCEQVRQIPKEKCLGYKETIPIDIGHSKFQVGIGKAMPEVYF